MAGSLVLAVGVGVSQEVGSAVHPSVYLFALGTQCGLAWVFSLLFLALARTAREQHYFRTWTRAWLALALSLSALFVRFLLPLVIGRRPEELDGGVFSELTYAVYQSGKYLTFWWVLAGVLEFAGFRVARGWARWIEAVLPVAALLSVVASDHIEPLLLAQAPMPILTGLAGAWVLIRIPRQRRDVGTRLTAIVLALRTLLWMAYVAALLRPDYGAWPTVRNPWTLLSAHNTYFDLFIDVALSAGLVVLVLKDAQRRQQEAEAERNRLGAELERTERLRSLGTLVSGVAHELSSPLTAILGFAELLGSSDLDAEQKRELDVIREQGLRCRRIVRGLSTFSGHGSEALERLELRELIERVLRGFELELGRRFVTVRLQALEPVWLLADRFALEQLTANLLSNALQASPPGGEVSVSVSGTRDEASIVVEDQGPGFPQQVLERAFEPFFTTRQPGEGMGLGLAVVHGIVRAHEGTIRAANRSPRGASIRVSLPRRAGERAEEPVATLDIPRPPSGRGLELLVIENDPLHAEQLRRIGGQRGWRVSVASSGREGLAVLQAEPGRYDVVLCGLRIPPRGGIEIHDLLAREDPTLLERFLFTAEPGAEDLRAFARRSTRPVLEKPLDGARLALRIEALAAGTRVQ